METGQGVDRERPWSTEHSTQHQGRVIGDARAWDTADGVDQARREGEKIMEDLKTTGKKETLDQLDNFPLRVKFWVFGTAAIDHRSSYWLVGNHGLPILPKLCVLF